MKKHFNRSMGRLALLSTGLGSIIGSGWLFGAFLASKIAGPAAIFAWIIGAVVVLSIALNYVELGTMFPRTGGMVRYAHYSHGRLVGFIAAWATWISIVSSIPIEAIASAKYMASWHYPWAHSLVTDNKLTKYGLVASSLLVIVYFMLNYWGVELFKKTTAAITAFKILVPGVTIVGLIWSGFHQENFALGAGDHFAPYGWPSILTAVATSGIVFSFNGFQSPVNMAGEATNPARDIRIAVVGSILIALLIYLLLQVGFIGAVIPSTIASGWHGLNFSSPFADLAISANLNWLAMLLYLDAVVSPSGTGTIYTATSARMMQGMVRNGTMPSIFDRTPNGVPRAAMWFNLGVSFAIMFLFPDWELLAALISVATVISFLTGPVSLMALRKHAGNLPRSLRIPGMSAIAPFAFVCGSLVLYCAHWPLTGKVILVIVAGLPVYFYFQSKAGWARFRSELRSAWWMLAYLPAIALLSLVGGRKFGGHGVIPDGWDLVTVATVALVFFRWGVRSGLPTPDLGDDTSHEDREPSDDRIVSQSTVQD